MGAVLNKVITSKDWFTEYLLNVSQLYADKNVAFGIGQFNTSSNATIHDILPSNQITSINCILRYLHSIIHQ